MSNLLIRYEVGDHLAVYCQSDVKLVDTLGKLLDADLDQVISMKNLDPDNNKKTLFPCPTTYRTALSYYVSLPIKLSIESS